MALRESLTLSGQAMGNSSMNLPETEVKASSGQDRNQSMVQPLMRPGNCWARRLNLAPTGLKHRQTCSLSRTRPKKKLYRPDVIDNGIKLIFSKESSHLSCHEDLVDVLKEAFLLDLIVTEDEGYRLALHTSHLRLLSRTADTNQKHRASVHGQQPTDSHQVSQGILEQHQLQLDGLALLIELALKGFHPLPDVRQTALDGFIEGGVGVDDLTSLVVKCWLAQEVHKLLDGTINPGLVLQGDHLVAEDTLALVHPQPQQGVHATLLQQLAHNLIGHLIAPVIDGRHGDVINEDGHDLASGRSKGPGQQLCKAFTFLGKASDMLRSSASRAAQIAREIYLMKSRTRSTYLSKHGFKAAASAGRRVLGLKHGLHLRSHENAVSIGQGQNFVVIQHSVQVLNPDGINWTVKDNPGVLVLVLGCTPPEDSKDTIGPVTSGSIHATKHLRGCDGLGVHAPDDMLGKEARSALRAGNKSSMRDRNSGTSSATNLDMFMSRRQRIIRNTSDLQQQQKHHDADN
ncbi:MAG: hypothetical protein FRX49_09289 [Trebouxia sp. A1-2]|nr:MAG: hypothetical protein FRX49_09289 [Trebouxia sp. A1-2]